MNFTAVSDDRYYGSQKLKLSESFYNYTCVFFGQILGNCKFKMLNIRALNLIVSQLFFNTDNNYAKAY